MEEGEAGRGWESPYGRVHEMERERKGARKQGGGGYPPTERGERRQSLFVAKDSWSLGAGLQREIGDHPKVTGDRVGLLCTIPQPWKRTTEAEKDKDKESVWGGRGFSLGRGHRASREPRGGFRMTDKASGNQMC